MGVNAQSNKECELLKLRISGSEDVNKLCLKIYQECASVAQKKVESKALHDQCLKSLGDCQMAGQLSGEDLQRVENHYEKICKD